MNGPVRSCVVKSENLIRLANDLDRSSSAQSLFTIEVVSHRFFACCLTPKLCREKRRLAVATRERSVRTCCASPQLTTLNIVRWPDLFFRPESLARAYI